MHKWAKKFQFLMLWVVARLLPQRLKSTVFELIVHCPAKIYFFPRFSSLRLVIYSQNCLGIDLRISDIRFYLVKSVVRYQIVKFRYHFRDNSESKWPTSIWQIKMWYFRLRYLLTAKMCNFFCFLNSLNVLTNLNLFFKLQKIK